MSVDVTKRYAGESLGECTCFGNPPIYAAEFEERQCEDGLIGFVNLIHYWTADTEDGEGIGMGCTMTSRIAEDEPKRWAWAMAMVEGKPATAIARLQAWLDESIHRDAKVFRQDRCPDGARVWTVRLDDNDKPQAPYSAALRESLDDAIDAALAAADGKCVACEGTGKCGVCDGSESGCWACGMGSKLGVCESCRGSGTTKPKSADE